MQKQCNLQTKCHYVPTSIPLRIL